MTLSEAAQRIGANSRQLARTRAPQPRPAPEMFSSFSASAEAHRLVIHHRLNLSIRPVEHTASSRRFANCSAGVVHPTHQVCCNATCGLCGGHGCSSRPGGPRQCCMPAILRTGRVCESQADVACSLRGSSNPFNSIRARPRRTRGSRSPLTTSEQVPPRSIGLLPFECIDMESVRRLMPSQHQTCGHSESRSYEQRISTAVDSWSVPSSRQSINVTLWLSGMTATLHGMVKPALFAMSSGVPFVTPMAYEWTTSRCARRDWSCWFDLNASSQSHPGGMRQVRYPKFKFAVHPSTIAGLEEITRFELVSRVMGRLLRPNHLLQRLIEVEMEATGLTAALRRGPVIGVHIRHGDSCAKDGVRTARRCDDYDVYMREVYDLMRQSGANTMYVASDDPGVFKRPHPNVTMLYSTKAQPSMEHLKAHTGADNWDVLVRNWGGTPIFVEAVIASFVDVYLLSMCDLFVGKFTSNAFRTAFELRSARSSGVHPFVSLDSAWCFDYFTKAGRSDFGHFMC